MPGKAEDNMAEADVAELGSIPAANTETKTKKAPRPASRKGRLPLRPILLFLSAWLGGSWLIVGGWLETYLPGGWLTVAAIASLAILPIRQLIRGFTRASYPGKATRLFLLRPFWYAMLSLPLLAVATLAGAGIGLPFGAARTTGDAALATAAILLAAFAFAGYLGSRRLVVRSFEVRLPRLPKAFEGMRLVQLSDTHVGPHTPKSQLARIAQATLEAKPDLLAITGDQVDDFPRDVEIFNQAFGRLKAPLGVFAIPGNHDIYAGWEEVRAGLEKAGIKVLVNDAVALERGGEKLWIAGTGDPAGRQMGNAAPDLAKTLAKVPPAEPVIALAHNPALWPALAANGVDLTLSGHTHYGQFAIPSRKWSVASAFLELAMGAHRKGRSLLYIHPGTLYWGLPLRVGTPPEVAVLTLRRGEGEESSLEQTGVEKR
jgi:predicted MPP superfamily phosphohydrolase